MSLAYLWQSSHRYLNELNDLNEIDALLLYLMSCICYLLIGLVQVYFLEV
jgi:hypothetical protein